MSYPRICVPKLLTPEQKTKAVRIAVQENHFNLHFGGQSPVHMALEVGRKWANGRVIHVRFLNGDATQKLKAEREAHRWEAYANIKFVFDDSPNAEVRVAFYDGHSWPDQGSWSYLGTDCLTAPPNEQTVNFGWLDASTPDDEWQRVVVHEFGHVLGCIHEDQQPAENIKWNKDAVYKWFEGPPNNWSKQDVDDNVLDPSGQEGIVNTAFDQISIMAYEIPPEFTLDGKGVPGGNVLSDMDKQMIASMYPIGVPVITTTNVLVPGGPICNGVINALTSRNEFRLKVTDSGTYRLWTSFTGGLVTVHSPNGAVGHGPQQVTLDLSPGDYTVVVQPVTHGNTAAYRIHSVRIR